VNWAGCLARTVEIKIGIQAIVEINVADSIRVSVCKSGNRKVAMRNSDETGGATASGAKLANEGKSFLRTISTAPAVPCAESG